VYKKELLTARPFVITYEKDPSASHRQVNDKG
jgi:hypothetical protein